MSGHKTYQGVGPTLEEATKAAHDQIHPRPGKDFTVSKVLSWGMQFGGFSQITSFYVIVEEDEHAPFRT